MMRRLGLVAGLGLGSVAALGQVQVKALDAHTSAGLRGVDAVSEQVAWASGSEGTVLRTTDGGANWKACTVPEGAQKLDFRGVQGFDAETAVVMASGKGVLSAIYRTTDGCATWKMVFRNPDALGFFDVLKRVTSRQMYLLGDPVEGRFAMFYSSDKGENWFIADDPGREAPKDAGAFAASNSSFAASGNTLMFGTGATATDGARVYRTRARCPEKPAAGQEATCSIEWVHAQVPVAAGSASAGVFSLASRTASNQRGEMKTIVVAVGGDYAKPDAAGANAATSVDGGEQWTAAVRGPAGYRSAVAYDKDAGQWIAVGPTGIDVSSDDGKNWSPVPGAGTGWNAVSLPFVVGAKGKVGLLK